MPPAERFTLLLNLRCDRRVNEWLCHSGRDLCWCHWIRQSSLLLPLCFWPTTVEPNSREHTGPLAVCCRLEISVWFTCLSNVFIHGGFVLDVSHGTDYVEMTCLFWLDSAKVLEYSFTLNLRKSVCFLWWGVFWGYLWIFPWSRLPLCVSLGT